MSTPPALSFRLWLFIFLLSFALPVTAQVDSYSKVPAFYQGDLKIGKEILRIRVKEIFADKRTRYLFLVDMEGSPDTFSLARLESGDYAARLFYLKLSAVYREFYRIIPYTLTPADRLEMAEIATRFTGRDTVLTPIQKRRIETIVNEAGLSPLFSEQQLLVDLRPLVDSVRRNPAVTDWLNERLSTAFELNRLQKNTALNEFEKTAASLYDEIYEALQRSRPRGPKVGTIYAKAKAKLYSRGEVKTENGDTTIVADCRFGQVQPNKKQRKRYPRLISATADTEPHLAINAVELEFEYGELSSVKVSGRHSDPDLPAEIFPLFQNRAPVSFSTKADVSQDFRWIRNTHLYAADEVLDGCYLNLRDVIYDDYTLLNRTENYSPIDTSITVYPYGGGQIVYKEDITDIMQARIYTDFMGIDSDRPNGLVQVEVSKRFFINSTVRQISSWYTYWGMLNYIRPHIMLTKLEQNEKFIEIVEPLMARSDTLALPEVNTLDVFQRTNFISGGRLNIARLGLRKFHSSLFLDLGADLHLTGVSTDITRVDTTQTGVEPLVIQQDRNQENITITSLSLVPTLVWNVNPHPNYSISLSYQWQFLNVLDERVRQTGPGFFFGANKSIHSFGFLAALKFNERLNGEFFFRAQFNVAGGNPNRNFFEAQLGYAFNIFSTPPRLPETRAIFN